MPFSFPLQTLLNWKRNLEELAQMRLAEKVKKLKVQEEEIEKLVLKRLSYEQELKEKSHRGLSVNEYLLYRQFAEDSYRDLVTKEEKKKETMLEIDGERETLIELTKEKKTLEKLKERKFKIFRYQMGKAEQKENDEMTTMKYRPAKR